MSGPGFYGTATHDEAREAQSVGSRSREGCALACALILFCMLISHGYKDIRKPSQCRTFGLAAHVARFMHIGRLTCPVSSQRHRAAGMSLWREAWRHRPN